MGAEENVECDDALATRESIVRFIRLRARMADSLARFGGSGGGVLHGLADEIENCVDQDGEED